MNGSAGDADLPSSPAAERNQEPIRLVLARLLPARARVLEIASGYGQHAAHFAKAHAGWSWQPTDAQPAALPVIARRCGRISNVATPLMLDVLARPWPVSPASADAVYCANMLHIAPWSACPALFAGADEALAPGGVIVTYGPYFVDGVAAAPSNLAFDVDLRARDSAWGIRRLAEVERAAAAAGFSLVEQVAMPANNLLLAWRRIR